MTSKLTGNSLYSASLLNKHSHRDTSYHDDTTVNDIINSPYFTHLDIIEEGLYEVKCLKKRIKNDLPIQIGFNVYMNAKLHMLKFYYLFLKKFIPDRHFQLIESDTDSYYFSISKDSLDDCVPVNLRREYFTEKRLWMPTEVCDHHLKEFEETKVSGNKWSPPPCCKERYIFQKRVGGLFKVEYEKEKFLAFTCKTYFCAGIQHKQVSKGISLRQNPLTFDKYFQVLKSNVSLNAVNQGFMSRQHHVHTYKQEKRGLNSFYCKRKVSP